MPNLTPYEAEKLKEFDEKFLYFHGKPMEKSLKLNHNNVRSFLLTSLRQARQDEREVMKKEKDELADALISMYEQYCDTGHDFMGAGEEASLVLESQRYATFDGAGKLLTILSNKETNNCKCACHENKLNKPYDHDTICCENMNGTVIKETKV